MASEGRKRVRNVSLRHSRTVVVPEVLVGEDRGTGENPIRARIHMGTSG